jgi:glycosyltransferase involved in cell wall biosynthesis
VPVLPASAPAETLSVLKGQHVIFVLGNLELGGAERQAMILARRLAEHERATVEVWGFNKSGPVKNICEQHGIRWRVVPYPLQGSPLKRLKSLLQFAWTLRRARPDILLPYTSAPNVACGLVWKWTGARVCVWNQRDEGLVPLTTRRERWAVKQTPHFVANASAGARFLIDNLNVPASKVQVVQNGIEASTPKLDRHAWRKRLEIDDTSFVACMIANLHTNKDHATLLRAWRTVVNARNAAVLVLAGRHDGAYESLVALSCALGIERSVRFAGQVSDVSGLLSAADIGVFSSRSEGCPNSVLECMAAGLAVVGTDIEGVREVVGSSGVQLLAPPEDAATLAKIILKVADDPGLCAKLGSANRKRAGERFNSERMCEETVSVLVKFST